ncbi:polyphenol oxidase [Sphingopyxis sp. H050]|uniref:peptidoglycan editing factor PgeF n=1 Tax=Sphingopyxis sp. H050 TaxID=1759072 RepID=UPI000737723F|nr:peptidoglycan editing factor PgeF [Sphingopyxis sp. H050]KTE22707.1 polyphenol oxidase [Sphingopyxis sp. H050]
MTAPFVSAPTLAGIPHGFFGRQGGVSSGDLASLNCGLGSGDDPDLIAENRRRVADAVLPGATLTGLYQVHGDRCVIVDDDTDLAARPQADALATRSPGILLGILTADCVPVLFADREAGVVGAAHTGWKGAIAGVTDSTLGAMESLGASRANVAVAIGPCIGRASYEVDENFVQRFAAADPANERFFAAGKPGHAMFDIAAYVAARLAAAGVSRIAIGGQDTYAEEADYFSYRRACHKGENTYGRQLSVIGLAGG